MRNINYFLSLLNIPSCDIIIKKSDRTVNQMKNTSSKIMILSLLILAAAVILGVIAVSKWKSFSSPVPEETGSAPESTVEFSEIESQTEDMAGEMPGDETTGITDITTVTEKITASETVSQTEKSIPATTVTVTEKQTTSSTTAAKQVTTVPVTTAMRQPSTTASSYKYSYAGLNPSIADVNTSQWNLMLVNRDYILPENYTPNLAPSVTADSSSAKLDSRVAPHYNEMYLAAKADGITLTPVSGYRSYSRQQTNFENKIAYYQNQGYSKNEATLKAAERILPPGTSEHNAGLAMDIITADSTANFQNTKAYAWLDAHAADYGFILRYPSNKQDVTKIIYEPWHWRYVGVEAAKAMKASGQCLEEYLGKA